MLHVDVDDPRREDVAELLGTHLAFSRGVTPVEYSFAMEADRLAEPDVTFYSARDDGILLGVAALKHLDDDNAELKSMHTRQAARGRGVARALLEHIVGQAVAGGYRHLKLETGTSDEFSAARQLYQSAGFTPCGPYADYRPSPHNTFMTLDLDPTP